MFIVSNKYKIFLKKDFILKKKYIILLENISINITYCNCLIKGLNGSGKTLFTSKLVNNNIININYTLEIYNILINYLYIHINIFLYKFLENKIFKELSYGNKQLFLSILKIWLINRLLILDEPFNGLDKINKCCIVYKLIKLILECKQKLLITHKNFFKIKHTLLYL